MRCCQCKDWLVVGDRGYGLCDNEEVLLDELIDTGGDCLHTHKDFGCIYFQSKAPVKEA